MHPPPFIELLEATAGYASSPVFADLSIGIAEGAFLGVIGPTGGGKTTLLKALIGTLPLHRGAHRLWSRPVRRLPAGTVGYLPQRRVAERAFPMTVSHLIAMGLPRHCPWLNRADRARVLEVIDSLALTDCRDHPVSDLSGGQQQRAFLGRALVSRPRLLVLDEPTSDVDPQTAALIRDLLFDLHRRGTTILLSTHSIHDLARRLPELVLFNRRVIARGHPDQVLGESRSEAQLLVG